MKEFDDHLMQYMLQGRLVDTALTNCFLGAVGLIPEISEPLPTRDFEPIEQVEEKTVVEDLSAEWEAFKNGS
ncbi:hypothetical protein [Leucobacter chromiireducens]|uniref:hypothetical protein n=1 Tax=Leucobacter chromiireducens TaxID=283877 RepID=UPI0019294754|nr:hypothetical protein [Leucobacter chromiireducens]